MGSSISQGECAKNETARCCERASKASTGRPSEKPRRPADHPDPERLGTRFTLFESSAA
jgi:hypothetical protein